MARERARIGKRGRARARNRDGADAENSRPAAAHQRVCRGDRDAGVCGRSAHTPRRSNAATSSASWKKRAAIMFTRPRFLELIVAHFIASSKNRKLETVHLRARAELTSHILARESVAIMNRFLIVAILRITPLGLGPSARWLCCTHLSYRAGSASSLVTRRGLGACSTLAKLISGRPLRTTGAINPARVLLYCAVQTMAPARRASFAKRRRWQVTALRGGVFCSAQACLRLVSRQLAAGSAKHCVQTSF